MGEEFTHTTTGRVKITGYDGDRGMLGINPNEGQPSMACLFFEILDRIKSEDVIDLVSGEEILTDWDVEIIMKLKKRV